MAPLVLIACGLSQSASADETASTAAADPGALLNRLDAISGRLDTVAKTQESQLKPLPLALPSLTFDVPSAYGAAAGDFGIGLGYQERQRYGHRDDAVEGLAVGFGDASKVGLEVEAINRDTSRPFRSTAVGFKVHRILPHDTAIAVGIENITINGGSDSDRSAYVTVTREFKLRPSSRQPFSRFFLTSGLGNGRFRSEHDVAIRKKVVNNFDCAAITLGPPAMFFVEWSGQDFNVGLSLVPFRDKQFVITPAISDITRSAGDGSRFTLGISYIFSH